MSYKHSRDFVQLLPLSILVSFIKVAVNQTSKLISLSDSSCASMVHLLFLSWKINVVVSVVSHCFSLLLWPDEDQVTFYGKLIQKTSSVWWFRQSKYILQGWDQRDSFSGHCLVYFTVKTGTFCIILSFYSFYQQKYIISFSLCVNAFLFHSTV